MTKEEYFLEVLERHYINDEKTKELLRVVRPDIEAIKIKDWTAPMALIPVLISYILIAQIKSSELAVTLGMVGLLIMPPVMILIASTINELLKEKQEYRQRK